MTAAVLALPAPLCEICGDGAPEDYRPDSPYAARGVIFADSPICVECAAFSVLDGMHEDEDFTWWTSKAASDFAAQFGPIACEMPGCRVPAAFTAGGGAVGEALFACKAHGPDSTAAMVTAGTIHAEDAWEWEAIR